MNRRDFLTRPRPAAAPDFTLYRFSRRAMATTFEILLPLGTANAADAADAAFDLIDRLEDQLTVYRKHSEISRLNRLAAVTPVAVEARLYALLGLGQWLARETDGAFDMTAGPLVRAWGFFRRQGRLPDDRELADALGRVGHGHVELLEPDRVRFRRPGVEINLGGIGKGYALDLAGELLRREWGVASALLHAGGSSVLAIGRPPGDRAWAVRVRHPSDDGSALATVRLADRALATSAATFQHFDYNHRKLGHLIDPRSGRPAEGTASATAVAPTAAEADALSTAFYVAGHGGTAEICGRNADYGAAVLPDSPDAVLAAVGAIDLTRPEPEPLCS